MKFQGYFRGKSERSEQTSVASVASGASKSAGGFWGAL